jgi:hypothetical protein
VRTASVAQVRQPVYKRSVARWKHYEPALGALFNNLIWESKAIRDGEVASLELGSTGTRPERKCGDEPVKLPTL